MEWDGQMLCRMTLPWTGYSQFDKLISGVVSRDGFSFLLRPTSRVLVQVLEKKEQVESLQSIIKAAIRVGPDRQDRRSLSLNLPWLPVQGVGPPAFLCLPLPQPNASFMRLPPTVALIARRSMGKNWEQINTTMKTWNKFRVGKKQIRSSVDFVDGEISSSSLSTNHFFWLKWDNNWKNFIHKD